MLVGAFQSNIQENKDWNSVIMDVDVALTAPFRATSKRTRIETKLQLLGKHIDVAFQSNIQENKDWNKG